MDNKRDIHMDAWIDKEIPGFVERIAVTSDENGKVPGWMDSAIFTFFTILFLTWPYRWMFNYKTGKTTYEIKKKFFAFPKPTSSPENEFANNPGYCPPSVPTNYPYHPKINSGNPKYNHPNYPDGASNYPPPNYDLGYPNKAPTYPDNGQNYPPKYPDNAQNNPPKRVTFTSNNPFDQNNKLQAEDTSNNPFEEGLEPDNPFFESTTDEKVSSPDVGIGITAPNYPDGASNYPLPNHDGDYPNKAPNYPPNNQPQYYHEASSYAPCNAPNYMSSTTDTSQPPPIDLWVEMKVQKCCWIPFCRMIILRKLFLILTDTTR